MELLGTQGSSEGVEASQGKEATVCDLGTHVCGILLMDAGKQRQDGPSDVPSGIRGRFEHVGVQHTHSTDADRGRKVLCHRASERQQGMGLEDDQVDVAGSRSGAGDF